VTKSNARAILACKRTVDAAIRRAIEKLSGDEKVFAENYWGASVLSAMSDSYYGSAPVVRAEETLDGQ
jgi:hypothetical protein